MAPEGAKDIHTTAHTRSDIGHRPNRGQWAGIKYQRGHFATVAHNSLVHSSTGFTPQEMISAEEPRVLLTGPTAIPVAVEGT
jgi:hypothetical protein